MIVVWHGLNAKPTGFNKNASIQKKKIMDMMFLYSYIKSQ